MTAIIGIATSAGLPRLMYACVFTAAVALGCSAVANADWDIQKYDECMKQPHQENDEGYHAFCCIQSGGVWTMGQTCAAPVNAQGPGETPTSRPMPPPGAVNLNPPTVATAP
jgi:hypothetical protein